MKKLTLSSTNKKWLGVCGGMGEAMGMDPTFLRLGFVLCMLCYGFGLGVYLVAWIVIPNE